MADDQSSSSQTSTSHTMTAFPSSPNLSQAPGLTPSSSLLDWLAPRNRHHFITPTLALVDASLSFADQIIVNHAGKLADEQEARLREHRKRKREKFDKKLVQKPLQIRKIHIQGFEVDTVWELARRVIDALRDDVERNLKEIEEVQAEKKKKPEPNKETEQTQLDGEMTEMDSEDEISEYEDAAKEDLNLETDDSDEDSEDADEDCEEFDKEPTGTYNEDPHGLNDGFFSIDEFNKQTELMERLNDSAGPYSGDASDGDEIDWNADPSKYSRKGL